jgi:hypothetical protein
MKFLIDESADARVAPHFRSQGHDVTLVAADYSPSTEDDDVLAIALREGASSSPSIGILVSWPSASNSRMLAYSTSALVGSISTWSFAVWTSSWKTTPIDSIGLSQLLGQAFVFDDGACHRRCRVQVSMTTIARPTISPRFSAS